MSELKLVLLTHANQAEACTLLSAAFADDPAYRYFLQDSPTADIDRQRNQLVRFIMAYHRPIGTLSRSISDTRVGH